MTDRENMLHNLFIQANLNTLLYVCNVCARLFTLTNCTDVVHTPYMHNARVCVEKKSGNCLQNLLIGMQYHKFFDQRITMF